MVIKHKNLDINVNTVDAPQPEALTGYYEWYLEYELLKKLYKEKFNSCILEDYRDGNLQFKDMNQLIEITSVDDYYMLDDNDLSLEEYCDQELKGKSFTLISGDSLILLLKSMVVEHNHSKVQEISITGHPFWVLHDIRHFKDYDSLDVYVDENSEEQRLNEAYIDLKALGLKHLVTDEMKKLISEDYSYRFNRNLNLKWITNDPY